MAWCKGGELELLFQRQDCKLYNVNVVFLLGLLFSRIRLKHFPMSNWIPISENFTQEIHKALIQQHQAAQFITMIAKSFIKEKDDDSNTNMDWSDEYKALIGRNIDEPKDLKPGLRLTDLTLFFIADTSNIIKEISLAGKSRSEVFAELKMAIEEMGMPSEKLTSKLHYSLPNNELDKGSAFDSNIKTLTENAIYRSNANLLLKYIVSRRPYTSEVRIWPHHFDTGSVIPVEKNSHNGLVKSIGIGFAIPDDMVQEPYFYISYWSADGAKNFKDLQPLDTGQWITDGWQGGVLKLSEIIRESSAEKQYRLAKSFFHSGIEIIKHTMSHG